MPPHLYYATTLPNKTQHCYKYQCYIFKCVTFQILFKSVQYWDKDQQLLLGY